MQCTCPDLRDKRRVGSRDFGELESQATLLFSRGGRVKVRMVAANKISVRLFDFGRICGDAYSERAPRLMLTRTET